MYNVVSVEKLSDSQKSKLRRGQTTRIKKGTGNQLHLTNEQLKKINSAANKGKAYTITLNPKQTEKHGTGIFGNIASKMKKLAIKHKDVLNTIIAGLKTGAKNGASKLAQAAQDKVTEIDHKTQDNIESRINTIEGEGVKRRRGRPEKGQGFGALLGPLIKLVTFAVIDAVAGAAKKKMGTGAAKSKKKDGGALMSAGIKGTGAKKTNAGKYSAASKNRTDGALFPA